MSDRMLMDVNTPQLKGCVNSLKIEIQKTKRGD